MVTETTPLTGNERSKRPTIVPAGGGEAEHEHAQQDNKDKPFTCTEKIKLFVFLLICPWLLSPLILAGAYLRTFPSFPPLWYGFWLVELSFSIGYLACFFLLVNFPRIVRERAISMPDEETNHFILVERDFRKQAKISTVAGFLIMSWDAVGRKDTFPVQLNLVGSAIVIFGLVWIVYVLRCNQYASRYIYQQEGHRLIITGPYSFIRHPMYLGVVIIAWLGIPLCMGSYWGLVSMAICSAQIAMRTYHEEEFLIQTFGEEYKDYQDKVRYRIVPYVF